MGDTGENDKRKRGERRTDDNDFKYAIIQALKGPTSGWRGRESNRVRNPDRQDMKRQDEMRRAIRSVNEIGRDEFPDKIGT